MTPRPSLLPTLSRSAMKPNSNIRKNRPTLQLTRTTLTVSSKRSRRLWPSKCPTHSGVPRAPCSAVHLHSQRMPLRLRVKVKTSRLLSTSSKPHKPSRTFAYATIPPLCMMFACVFCSLLHIQGLQTLRSYAHTNALRIHASFLPSLTKRYWRERWRFVAPK